MKNITIDVRKQMDGVLFHLTLKEQREIKKAFPEAHPVPNLFVAYPEKNGVNTTLFRAPVLQNLFPVLTGIEEPNQWRQIQKIDFVDVTTGEKLYSIIN